MSPQSSASRSRLVLALLVGAIGGIILSILMSDGVSRQPSFSATRVIENAVVSKQLAQAEARLVVSTDRNARDARKIARLAARLSHIVRIRHLPDEGVIVAPAGGCHIPFVGREAHPHLANSGTPKPRVAVSLVVIKDADMLTLSLQSLVDSDIMDAADVAIFVWLNMPDSEAATYIKQFKGAPLIMVQNPEGTNLGIVIPRIRVMDAMLAHGCNFQYFLEIHDDMVFFDNWFAPLLKYDQPDYGIIMPFIITGCKCSADA